MYHNNPAAAADKLLETHIRGKAETSRAAASEQEHSSSPHHSDFLHNG